MKSAKGYVQIAEKLTGLIPKPVNYPYIWGDSLHVLDQYSPDLRLINLETSVTTCEDYWKGKGIHYRMHPKNIHCITSAKIDACCLANNHVLDWGYPGLVETLETLQNAGLKYAGAGLNLSEAQKPAILPVNGKGRVLFFAYGTDESGVPKAWAATKDKPGVNFLGGFSDKEVNAVKEQIEKVKKEGDIVVFSVHWGGNWGYEIDVKHRSFARKLIEVAGVDVIHGHSSHHAKGIEVYKGKLILYGCGDFFNDYEGIGGSHKEEYRDDLGVMYFASVDAGCGKLMGLEMVPMKIERFRMNVAGKEDVMWMKEMFSREGKKLGSEVEMGEDGMLRLIW